MSNDMKNRTGAESLDDLFRSARRENVPEVLSRKEVGGLVSGEAVRSVPQAGNFAGWLQRNFISTPLRIGATLMTSTALITAAVLAGTGYFVSTQAPPPPVARVPAAIHQQFQTSYAQPPATVAAITPGSIISTPLRLFASPILLRQVETIKDSLIPVDLSPDQLARLGIELRSDGVITFYRPMEEGAAKGMRVSLTPDGGTKVEGGVDLPKNSLVTQNTVPTLITDRAGIRRYATILVAKNKGYSVASVISDSASGMKSTLVSSAEVSQAPGDTNKRMLIVNTSTFTTDSSNRQDEKVSDIHGRMLSLMNMHGIMHSNGDTLEKHNIIIRKVIRHEDGANEFSEDSSVTMSSHDYNVDSMVRALVGDGVKSGKHKFIIQKQFHIDTRNNLNAVNQALIKHIDATPTIHNVENAIEMVTASRNSMVNLIPVRVRNLNNSAKPNEVIFWYDSIPELRNLLPIAKAGVNRSSSQIALSVYPNPTNGPATIHYELKSASDVHFALHNLLGQKIMDIGDVKGQQGDEAVDLSKLDAGIYLLITTTGSGERNIERVVVTK